MSTFAPHKALPYPLGHNIKNTCIKCGRPLSHEIHKTENIKIEESKDNAER